MPSVDAKDSFNSLDDTSFGENMNSLQADQLTDLSYDEILNTNKRTLDIHHQMQLFILEDNCQYFRNREKSHYYN